VEHISGGDLDTKIQVNTGDEIQTLAEAFNAMTSSLTKYIADLTSVTAEKERIGAELNVATQIQRDMLPSIFPAFPDRQDFDIYATMDPAKEVGGDFYDFFMVDDSHLAVVMADVSGKGVPAALFMVIAKTIIKNQALTGDPVEMVFDRANDQLCENNGEGLFVTAFMGVLDLQSGEFVYTNAGHNPPLLRRSGETYEYLKLDPGFVLAGLEGMQYECSRLTLRKGDTLFFYTDGVTEALNPEQELFGEERLRSALNADAGRERSVTELLPYLRSVLDDYARGAEQADDITMLGLTYQGQESGGAV
jgi:sigma-B regulation protein RsbU (phosphoserine phosphatase)